MLSNVIVKGESLDEVWLTWFKQMIDNKISEESRDGEVASEIINAITVLENPTKNIMTNQVRKLSAFPSEVHHRIRNRPVSPFACLVHIPQF